VGQDTISGVESGKHEPRPSTLRKLAGALDTEVSDLFSEELTSRPKGRAPLPPDDAVQAAGPQSLEWALAASDEEFSVWIRNSSSLELHETWIKLSKYAEGLENGERHRFVTSRTQEAIARYFRLNPPRAVRPRKSQVSADTENQESREVG